MLLKHMHGAIVSSLLSHLLSPAIPPATGLEQLLWMESYGRLEPSGGNLGKIRRHHVTRTPHRYTGSHNSLYLAQKPLSEAG